MYTVYCILYTNIISSDINPHHPSKFTVFPLCFPMAFLPGFWAKRSPRSWAASGGWAPTSDPTTQGPGKASCGTCGNPQRRKGFGRLGSTHGGLGGTLGSWG